MYPFAPDIARDTRNALDAIKAQGESERFWRINRYEGAFDGLDVDGLPNFWDTSVPLRERAPALRAQLPKIAARRLVALLFSDRAFPGVTVAENAYGVSLDETQAEALSDLVAEIVRVARIPSVMRAVTMAALRSGTAVAVTGIRDGVPVVDMLPAKCCTPTFDANGKLSRVEYMQKIPRGDTWMLHRRVITAASDTTYEPVDVATLKRDTDLDSIEEKSVRLLSFMPVVWVRNAPDESIGEVDGYPIHHGLLAEITAADMEVSQLHRTALYNGEPVMVRMGVSGEGTPAPMGPQGRAAMGASGAEAEHGAASWSTRLGGFVRGVFGGASSGSVTKRAPNTIWNLPQGADAKMLESSGAGSQILTTALDRHSRIVTDAMGVILAQPGDLGGNAMSSRSLAIMFAPMLATADEMRVLYGSVLCDIVGMLLRWCHVTAEGVHVAAVTRARSALSALSVSVSDGSSRWSAAPLSLQWGEYFEPSWTDVSAAIDAAQKATGGRAVMSQRSAALLVAPVVGISDVDAELDAIRDESGADAASMRDVLSGVDRDEPEPVVDAGNTSAETAPTPGAEAVADTALNGAQVTALAALTRDVTAGLMAVESAVEIAVLAFRIDEPRARRIMEPAARFKSSAPAPPPASPPGSTAVEDV